MTHIPLGELAERCGADLTGDPSLQVSGPASLRDAGPTEVAFLAQRRYLGQLAETRAAAVVVGRDLEVPEGGPALLRCDDPNATFTRVIRAFTPAERARPVGVHPTASVHPEAAVDPSASVGPLCSVGPGARVGAGAVLVAGVHVGDDASVGERSVLHPGVVLYARVAVGADCILHGGVVLGSDGFGFEPSAAGWAKVPQCGTVVVGDRVELGANVTVDRARFGATRIGHGVKADNLVHVGHNVVVGENVLLVAQVGVAGSTRIGAWSVLGGQVGVAGHLELGERCRVGGGSDVFIDVPPGTDMLGSPARPRMETLRAQAATRKVPEALARLRALEGQVEALARDAARDQEPAPSGEETTR